jgi:putative ABC transport system permease protein
MSFVTHDEHPFEVVGILAETFTPVDRALYVTLEGIEAIHEGWDGGSVPAIGFGGGPGGAPMGGPPSLAGPRRASTRVRSQPGPSGRRLAHPRRGEPSRPRRPGQRSRRTIPPSLPDTTTNTEISAITSFFVGTRSRIDALQLQREINTFEDEPMMAILPGRRARGDVAEVGYAEDALKIVTAFVVIVGLLGMIVSLYTSLNERRREMAILRAVGAPKGRIVSLLVLESGLLLR